MHKSGWRGQRGEMGRGRTVCGKQKALHRTVHLLYSYTQKHDSYNLTHFRGRKMLNCLNCCRGVQYDIRLKCLLEAKSC